MENECHAFVGGRFVYRAVLVIRLQLMEPHFHCESLQ